MLSICGETLEIVVKYYLGGIYYIHSLSIYPLHQAPCPSMPSNENAVVGALCACACVFKLYAHYTTCDNSGPTVQQDSSVLWRVSLLISC